MNRVGIVIAVIAGMLVAEARLSRLHERMLRARGAVAPPGDVYTALAVLYPGIFLAMAAEGFWRASQQGDTGGQGPNWFMSGVLLFVASKAVKYWAIRTLGVRWAFRVLVVPGWPLVTTGPYRYFAHPNYVAVVGELAGAAMMCGAPIAGTAGLVVFGAVLWQRVRFEAGVLRRAREESRG